MRSRLRVHHLECACIRRLHLRGKPLCCHVLLVETPSSGLVLVDTGLGTLDYADMTSRLTRSFVYGYARPEPNPAYAAIHQIRALGLDPADVRHIVMTHMDLDHVGGLADFPHATVHLHAAETRHHMQELLTRIWESHRLTVLFITHDVEEAVYLSDRVLVMSNQPGRIKQVVPVPLARPRPYDITATADFLAVHRQVLTSIREESIKLAELGAA